MIDRSRLILRSLVPALLFVAMLGVWIGTRLGTESDRTVHGWKVLGGELSGLNGAPDSGTYVNGGEAARLIRAATILGLRPHTRIEFSEGDVHHDAAPLSLPRLLEGSYEVETDDSAFLVDGALLEADGTVRFVLTGRRITILDGQLRFDERIYARGESFTHPRGIVSPVRPGIDLAPRRALELPDAPRGENRPTGRVIDARSGHGVPDARVRGTFSHMDNGYPPLPVERSRFEARTDAGGYFTVPDFRPDDPQLYVHLEVLHADFLPRVHVIERKRDRRNPWPFTTLSLRPGRVETLTFVVDPSGVGLAHSAIQIDQVDEEGFVGEDSWEEGRSVRLGRRIVRYTDENGEMPIEFTPISFTLLHPEYYFWNRRVKALLARYGMDPLKDSKKPSALHPWNEIPVRAVDLFGSRLVDERGDAVSHSLVEVTLPGGPRVLRMYTDAEGSISIAPLPEPGSLSPDPTVAFPCELTTLSPLLWKVEASFYISATPRISYLPGRGGSEFRLEITDENEKPIAHGPVELDDRLTLVHHSADGELRFQGALSTTREIISLRVNGFVPLELRLPARLPGEPTVDMGAVRLQRGESLNVRLIGGDTELYERARLLISGDERLDVHHEFAFDESGRVVATGLERGRRYSYAVEGSRLVPTKGEFQYHEAMASEGLEVFVESSEELDVRVGGRVVGVRKPGFRVVERFHMSDGSIRTFKSYPLSPDGLFGSRRFSAIPDSVEVFILGEAFEGVHARRFDPSLSATFDFGKLTLEAVRRAVLRFRTEGGIVAFPPANLSLFCDEYAYHEVARIHRLNDGELLLRNLVPATYALRWKVGSKRGGHVFEIRRQDLFRQETVILPPELVDRTIVRIVDSGGRPLENVDVIRVTSPRDVPGRQSPIEPDRDDGTVVSKPGGLTVVPIDPRTENRYHFSAPETVPVELTLASGRPFPDPLVLPDTARLRAHVLAPDGLPFNGALRVTAEPIDEEPERRAVRVITRKEEELPLGWKALPFEVRLRQGNLISDRVLVGLQEILFRDASSEAEARVLSRIRPGDLNNLGAIQLEESRRLIGRVYLPDGSPATGATVALVAPEHANRYPQRDDPIQHAAYSARTDALGRFRIRGLPLDLDGDYTLVAHADGWTDAIEDPVDLDIEEHELLLTEDTQLVLDIGYDRGGGNRADDFEFRLWYEFFTLAHTVAEARRLDLGPLAPTPRGGRLYRGVTPGTYVVTWALKASFPGAEPRSSRVWALRGRSSKLRLRVDDEFLSGRALFNATPLKSGWVVFTDDPAQSFLTRVGRVRNGTYVLPVPRRAQNGYVALIPERDPMPAFNPARGEALPQPVRGFRTALRAGVLDIYYEAFDLTVELPSRLFDRPSRLLNGKPRLSIEFPHYRAGRTGAYVQRKQIEALSNSTIRFHLLPRGTFAFRVLSGKTTRLIQSVDLYEDMTLNLR